MADINLSQRDIDYIGRVVETEVPASLARSNPRAYESMVKAVVDTITNRVASPSFPNSVTGVVNQHRQFSKITGPARLAPHGSVQNTPRARAQTQSIVSNHLAARARGAPSVVGGALHYANPHYSDRSNLTGWINPMIEAGAQKFGVGRAVHFHGNAPGFRGAPEYSLNIDGLAVQSFDAASLPTPDPNAGALARSQRQTAGLLMDMPADLNATPAPVERRSLPGPNVAQSYIDAQRTRAPSMTVAPTPVERTATPAPAPTAAPSPSVSRLSPTERIDMAMAVPVAAPAANPRDYAVMSSLPAYATAPRQTMSLPPEVAPYSLTQPPPAAAIRARNTRRMSVPAPAPAPRPVPPPAVPVPAPPPAPVPTQSPASRPGAPSFAQSMPTGFDVWGGRANFGIAQKGYELSRLDNGNVARYSPQFDWTDISTPDGSRHVRSVQGRIDGPVGQGRVSTPGPLDALSSMRSPARTDLGSAIRGGLGGVAGGMAGSALGGPIGGLLGAALGRQVAAGGLLSRGGFGPQWTSPSMGWASQQGAPAVGANGFPAAPPSPPGGGSNPTDFDMDHARSVSPAAADAASRGIGGLW
jgi:hypothetical protein